MPLALLPVLIHLLNRLRHRSVAWAAMMFLLSASRSSSRFARLRQILVLACRVIAVASLVFAMGRPLAGGWLGWMFAPAPDVIMILLDRSASMETGGEGGGASKRQQALRFLAQSARPFEETSRLVLLESALRMPQEIASAQVLTELSLTAATDTAADLPSMLQVAADWLVENRVGLAEIWIASDLQRSNWQPESDRWPALASRLGALPQSVRVRLLALNEAVSGNTGIAVREVTRRRVGERIELDLGLDLHRNASSRATLPLSMVVDGTRTPVEVTMEGQTLRFRHRANLGAKDTVGWGLVQLPVDANPADNTGYFVYGTDVRLHAVIVSSDAESRRFLRLAVAPAPKGLRQSCEIVSAARAANLSWKDLALVVWQDPIPRGETARALQNFVEQGGVVIFFPSFPREASAAAPDDGGGAGEATSADATLFAGAGWGEVRTAEVDKPFRLARWNETDGPLARTEEGTSLAVSSLQIQRRRQIVGEKNVFAHFEDGQAFLTRRIMGKGQVYFCATAPGKDYSNLGDGLVLVPMMQRLLETGGRRLSAADFLPCGEWRTLDLSERWTCVDSPGPKDFRCQAGVYRLANRLLAVNRPVQEDEPEQLETDAAKTLFGELPVRLLAEGPNSDGALQGEMWRIFLFAMLAFLIAEAVLILPGGVLRKPATSAIPPAPSVQGHSA